MSDIKSTIWLLDDHEIRRVATAGFFSGWAERTAVKIIATDCAESIGAVTLDGQMHEMCILATGGTSLADPDLARTVHGLLDILDGRPLAIFCDLDSDEEVSLAIDLGVNGLISTAMSVTFAIAAIEFILSGGNCFKQSSLVNLNNKAHASGTNQQKTGLTQVFPSISPTAHEMSNVTQMRLAGSRNPPITDLSALIDPDCHPTLTLRQKDIVDMLKLGKSNKEIARLLEISDATVKIFVRQVMKKFGAINRTQVALLASDAMSPRDMRNGHAMYGAGLRSN